MTYVTMGALKALLRDRGLEVVRPSIRRPGTVHRTRLRRFTLPDGVVDSLHVPARNAMMVDMERTVNRAGFGYGPSGWHPFVAALEQHLADPDGTYDSSVLSSFYERFQPKTVHGLLLGGTSVPDGTLATWPAIEPLIDVWSATQRDVERISRSFPTGFELPHSQYRGPTCRDYGAKHLSRVADAYQSFVTQGYRPEAYGFVTGYFLTRGDDYRFVIGHGNHRVAALSVLGHRAIAVRFRQSHPPVVAESELGRWTERGGGLLGDAEVEAIFDRLFSDDSRDRARAMGLS